MDKIREKISNTYHKGPNWKEILIGPICQKYAFWFLIIFLAVLTVKDVYELCSEYMEDPKTTSFSIVFNESMTMPNITFCMSKAQGMSHFKPVNETEETADWDTAVQDSLLNMTDHDTFLTNQWDYRIVMEAYEVIATLNSMEREATAHGSARTIENFRTQPRLIEKRKIIKMYLELIRDRGVTFAEFTQKTGVEVLRRSMQRFSRTTYNEDDVIITKVRITWISQMEMCFSPEFDEDNFKTIDDQGRFFILLISHNAENLDGVYVPCMSADFHGRPSSFSRFGSGKGEVRDGYVEDLCLGARHEVSVEVRARYEMIENDDPGTICKELEEDDDRQFDCISRCRLEFIRQICNCTAHSLSYLVKDDHEFEEYPPCDYTACEIDVQRGNYTDEPCTKDCRRDCTQIRYQFEHQNAGAMTRKDFTYIELNWKSFEYLNLEQERKYTVVSFIASLGGSLGVWLGLSVLSLFQGITYFFSSFKHEVKKKITSLNLHDDTKEPRGERTVVNIEDGPYESNNKGYSNGTNVGSKIHYSGNTNKFRVNPIPNAMKANPFSNPFSSPSENAYKMANHGGQEGKRRTSRTSEDQNSDKFYYTAANQNSNQSESTSDGETSQTLKNNGLQKR